MPKEKELKWIFEKPKYIDVSWVAVPGTGKVTRFIPVRSIISNKIEIDIRGHDRIQFLINKNVNLEIGDIVAKVENVISSVISEEDDAFQIIEIRGASVTFQEEYTTVTARQATAIDKQDKLEEQNVLNKTW